MSNRTMQAKAMKLAKQRHAAPYQLNTRAMTPDAVYTRDCETGERVKPKRYEVKSVQRKLVLNYAPAGEWTLFPASEGKPARW